MKQVRRLEYFLRHARHFLPYVTPRKAANLARNLLELQLRRAEPRSVPPYLKVEPTPLCQLACPGCPHGASDFKKQIVHDKHLAPEEFRALLDPLADRVLGVSLSLRGEPLLARHLVALIRIAHERRVAVSFPTNFSVPFEEDELDDLVTSGLDAMFVSLDGATPETYGRYRVGGEFDLVCGNVRRIAAAKKRLRRRRPRLIWKFVVFDHNAHEVPRVKREYRSLGFDAYELVWNRLGPTARNADRRYKAGVRRAKQGCFWAWHTMIVRTDGEVLPCCKPHTPFALGNTREEGIEEIWRGERYAVLRRGFATMDPEDMHPVCARCLGVVREPIRGGLERMGPSPAPLPSCDGESPAPEETDGVA